MLQVSRSTAYRLRKEQDWPSYEFGKIIRFSPRDVEKILAMNRKPTKSSEPVRRPMVGTQRSQALSRSRNFRNGFYR